MDDLIKLNYNRMTMKLVTEFDANVGFIIVTKSNFI